MVYDFEGRRGEFERAVAPMIEAGTLVVPEDKVEGLENAPAHFCRLMRGENRGKALVQVAR